MFIEYIYFQFFRRICGKAPAAPKPTFSVLCLGLANSGKSTILTLLSGENADGIRPTVGKFYHGYM